MLVVSDHTRQLRERGNGVLAKLDGELLVLAVEALMTIENVYCYAAGERESARAHWETVRLLEAEVRLREAEIQQRLGQQDVTEQDPITQPDTPRAKALTVMDIEHHKRKL